MLLDVPVRQYVWGFLCAGGLLVALWLAAPVLPPFVLAAVLAYALAPAVDWAEVKFNRRVSRAVIVLVVEVVVLGLFVGLFLLVVPVFVNEIPLLREKLPELLDRFQVTWNSYVLRWGLDARLNFQDLKRLLFSYWADSGQDAWAPLLSSLKMGGSFAFAALGYFVLVPVVLFYLLLDWTGLVAGGKQLIPRRWRAEVESLMQEADSILGHYFRGQLMVMLALSVYYAVGLSCFGLDLALPIGVFTGLAVCVPYVGFGLGLCMAFFAGTLEMGISQAALMVGVVYGVGQMVESFYLTPRWVGDRIGLHPLMVIFSLLVFGQWLGFVGVLMALPVSAVLWVGVKKLHRQYLQSRFYAG